MRRMAAVLVAAVTGLFATGITAQTAVVLGTLSCTGGEGVGLIVGSKKTYECNFKAVDGRPTEHYRATVTRIGLDVGVTGESTMIWTVLTTSKGLGQRALVGTYAGAVADASLGIGAGAKVLLGGSKNAITLQPLSVQGQTGINLAIGVGEMVLR